MTTNTPFSILEDRRNRLAKAIQNGVVIIPTSPEYLRNDHTSFSFRPDSDFFYLTGFSEPESIAVWDIQDGEIAHSILFCRPSDPEREIWEGPRYGPYKAKEAFGFMKSYTSDSFMSRMEDFLIGKADIYYPWHAPLQWDRELMSLQANIEGKIRPGRTIPVRLHDIRPYLASLRLIKDAHEIDIMRHAARISVEAHKHAMAISRPGLYEYEIEAELLYKFRKAGGDAPAYPSIVASGPNACILHSVANNRLINPKELILVDAASEWGWYASDITRTWPSDGKFTGAQRDIYECVLASQYAALEAVKPDAPSDAPHSAALKVLTQGLIDLGLISHMNLDEAIEKKAYYKFYMHRTSHWIGLDVHDVGPTISATPSPLLKSGELLTIEPGLYCPISEDVPEAFRGIGVRIEDEVLVTETGMENLTGDTPKTIKDIETIVGSAL